jgi:hypothetical protein
MWSKGRGSYALCLLRRSKRMQRFSFLRFRVFARNLSGLQIFVCYAVKFKVVFLAFSQPCTRSQPDHGGVIGAEV